MKTAKELEKRFGVTAEEVERLAFPWENGELVGRPVGKIIVGRPLKFGEELRSVGFKETKLKVDAIDERAAFLGMKRSDYLRWVIDNDLEQYAKTSVD